MAETRPNSTGFKKPGFLKEAQPGGFFGFYWVLGFIGFFGGISEYEWQVLNVIHIA